MKGTITVNVNNATLVEAMQDYFDKQLAADKRMVVTNVEKNSNGYAGSLEVNVTLSEPQDGKAG